MSQGYSKCVCQHCGGSIEFPSEGVGNTVPCPHCKWPTLLVAAARPATVPVGGASGRKKRLGVSLVAAIIAAIAGAGFYWHWQLPQSPAGPALAPVAASQPDRGNTPASKPAAPAVVAPVVPPDPWHGLVAGPITLEKASDGHLVYAVGHLRNTSDHQRFGVKVELDVFNAAGGKVGTATDYTPSIDPGKEWKFKAMVTDRAAAAAKLAAVKEE
ncbi:MAG: FxLYD domain-containing protein [Limisphaerales bacterium]